jgi:hypothetical protein
VVGNGSMHRNDCASNKLVQYVSIFAKKRIYFVLITAMVRTFVVRIVLIFGDFLDG